MAGLSSSGKGETNMIPTPRFVSSSNASTNINWPNYSALAQAQGGGFSVPNIVPQNSSSSSTVSEDVLNRGTSIEDGLARAKSVSYQLPHAVNEGGNNDHGAYRNLLAKTFGCKTSMYRGVTKCNEERYEAYVWDNTTPGESGRTVYIGGYSSEIEAARAHDLVSIKIWGISTVTNFPVKTYWREIYEMQHMSKRDYVLAIRRKGKGYGDHDSPYRGVFKLRDRRRWEARLSHDGMPTIYLGTYYTAEDAARAYDIASIEQKGYEAITNFDLHSYDVKSIMENAKNSSWGISFPPFTQANDENQTLAQSSNPNTVGGSNYAAQLQQSAEGHANLCTGFNSNHLIMNCNRFLPQSSIISQNIELQKCLEDFPSSFGKKLLGVNMKFETLKFNMLNGGQGETSNAVSSFGLNPTETHQGNSSFGLNPSESQQVVEPSNNEAEFGATELLDFGAIAPNLNSFFSDDVQNPLPEPNSNTGSLTQTTEIPNDFDVSEYLDISFMQGNDLEGYLASIN